MATINTLNNKDLKIEKQLNELEQRITYYEKVAAELEKNFENGGADFVKGFAKEIHDVVDQERTRFWTLLCQANPDAMFLSACVDNMLQVLERHKIVADNEAIIVATIECASYQMWQKIKADAWGKNNTNVNDTKARSRF